MIFDEFIFKRLIPEIFSRPAMQPINRLLFRISISGMGVNNHDGRSRDENRFLRRLALPEETIILDVGANEGQFATLARRHFPTATIYSFEPNPASFSRLQQTAEAHRLKAIPLGCADRPGKLKMFDWSEDAGSELATFVPGVFEHEGVTPTAIEAALTTVDKFCSEQGIDHIGLLKIDVEGFEAKVLEGAERMLSATDYVQFEFNEMHLMSATTMTDLSKLLSGFSLHRILYDGSLLPLEDAPLYRQNLFTYQNIVAVRSPGRFPTQQRAPIS